MNFAKCLEMVRTHGSPNYWVPQTACLALFASALLVGLATVAAPALAGPVTIRTPDGGKVQIAVRYRNGSTATANTTDNGAGDSDSALGTFTFIVPDEGNAVEIVVKNLGAVVVGGVHTPVYTDVVADPGGILSFEPVNVPTVTSADAIVLETINLTSDTTSYKDVTSSFGTFSSFFDVFTELTLPSGTPFLGSLTEEPSMQFRVPEPATLTLLGLGLAGLGFMRRRRSA